MLKIFKFIGCFLERSERNYPRIFWLCTSLLGFFIFYEPVTTSSQSQIVIEQVRISRGGGSKSDSSSFVTRTNPYGGRKDSSQSQGSGQSLDSTKCYAHREAYNMPRSVSENFETKAVKKLYKASLKNLRVKQEYTAVKDLLEQGVHPINLSAKSTYVSPTKVLVKKPEGRYLIEVSDTSAEIVGVSSRTNQKGMSRFQTLMNELYNLDLQGY
jgi:hypothetical protein